MASEVNSLTHPNEDILSTPSGWNPRLPCKQCSLCQLEEKKEIFSKDLSLIVGKKITGLDIKAENSQGHTVGVFKFNQDQFVWINDPKEGYSVVTYCFGMDALSIHMNEKGIVVGTLSGSEPRYITKFGPFGKVAIKKIHSTVSKNFWWSKQDALHVESAPNHHPLLNVHSLDNQGNFLVIDRMSSKDIKGAFVGNISTGFSQRRYVEYPHQ